jgi:hypothetical protein
MRRHRTHDRDSSLLRLSRANRWLLAGSLALTGLLTDVVAHAFPGKAQARTRTSSPREAHKQHSHPRHHSTSTGTLKPPPQAPQNSEAAEAPGDAAQEPSPQATGESSSAPAEEPAPTQEVAPEARPEPAPEAEASAPVVSGGS